MPKAETLSSAQTNSPKLQPLGDRVIVKPVNGQADVKQVASISAESEELGAIIAETVDKVGKNGVVTVEESQGMELSYEVVEGLQIDKGYVSAYMVTNAERMEAEMKDATILITDKKIGSVQEILPLLEKVAQSGKKELVIIADDVEGDALSTFIVNRLRGTFSVIAVKAPGYGDRKKEMLADIAAVVGAEVISADTGATFENATLGMLGKAARVVATKDTTVFVGGKGKKADIEARVVQLKAIHANTDSKFDKEKLEERIAKLSGGVAVIRVGAATETEMKYLKDKIDDAVKATKASIEEGIVPGGGISYLYLREELKHWSYLNEDKDSIDVRFESFFSPFGASKIITLIYKGKFLKEVWRQNVWETKYFDGYWFHAMERYCTSDLFKDREVSESLIKW